MGQITLIDSKQLSLIINRLCFQLIENHDDFSDSVIVGLQPRGIFLAECIVEKLRTLDVRPQVRYGVIDPTFYRDDFRIHDKPLIAHPTEIPFSLEGQRVILVDDVLFTGRTVRAALEGLNSFGRPKCVQLAVLVDRGHRELPIRPDFVGKNLPTKNSDEVIVSADGVVVNAGANR
jgi:pyrimidine operon attenuation protein/uracil phosphoribosyltransferase